MFAVISRSEHQVSGGPVPPLPILTDIPRLQRSFGLVRLAVGQANGASAVRRVFQEGSAKLRFPRVAAGEPPQAVLLNIAGGMAGGDRQDVSVEVEENAGVIVTTQACERVYHSLGGDAQMLSTAVLGAGAQLEWLPQPLIFFDRGRLKREMQVTMAADATLLAVESVIFGRTASGEDVIHGALSDAWSIRRGGRLIHAERFHLDGAIRQELKKPFVLAGNRAVSALRYVAQDAQKRLEEMRTLLKDAAIPCAASAWNGMMLVRFVAPDGYHLTRELVRVTAAFRKRAMPRAWMV